MKRRPATHGRVLTVVLLALALLASALAVRSTGAADPLFFVADAGPLVRWSGPLLRAVQDLAASVTLGALVVSLFVVRAPSLRPLAGVAAVVWAASAVVGIVLTFADAAGLPLDTPAFVSALLANVWTFDVTRIGLVSTAGAVIVALGALSTPTLSRRRAAALVGVSVLSVAVLGLASHTGTSSDHETSVNAMAVHLVAAATWVGGLVALVVLRSMGSRELLTAVDRWSAIALWCFAAVALSGILAATTRLGAWSDLGTAYGLLVVVKAVALLALGSAGWLHRRSLIGRLAESDGGFWRLVVAEVAIMAATVGVATALARSAPPVPEDVPDATPAIDLTGFPAPPEPGGWSALLAWRVDWLLLALAAVAVGTYVVGLLRLRRVGQAWPAPRAAAWVAGWLLFAVATSGGAGSYGRVALSWHVALIATELLLVPLLLVIGDPVSLAAGSARPRRDGTVGAHEVAGVVTVRLLGNPFVTVGVTALILIWLVLGPGLDWTLRAHPGHVIVTAGLPVLGFFLVSSMVETAQSGARGRATVAVAALVFVVGTLGLVLVLGTRPLAADFFGSLGLPWLSDLVSEQRRAGVVVWVLGTIGAAGLALLLATARPSRAR